MENQSFPKFMVLTKLPYQQPLLSSFLSINIYFRLRFVFLYLKNTYSGLKMLELWGKSYLEHTLTKLTNLNVSLICIFKSFKPFI